MQQMFRRGRGRSDNGTHGVHQEEWCTDGVCVNGRCGVQESADVPDFIYIHIYIYERNCSGDQMDHSAP